MSQIVLSRLIAADPTSAALLLAGPSGMDLWPGLRRLAAAEHHVVAEADLLALPVPRRTRVEVRAERPRRAVARYVTRFLVRGEGLPTTTGTLTLRAGSGGPHLATEAVLALDVGVPDAGVATSAAPLEVVLRAMAAGFLDNLAAAAERPSHAA